MSARKISRDYDENGRRRQVRDAAVVLASVAHTARSSVNSVDVTKY